MKRWILGFGVQELICSLEMAQTTKDFKWDLEFSGFRLEAGEAGSSGFGALGFRPEPRSICTVPRRSGVNILPG